MTQMARTGNVAWLAICCLSLIYSNSVPGMTVDERKMIEKAIPTKATAVAKKPRKLLVFNLHVWDGQIKRGHESIPYGNLAIELMGKKTAAYEAIFSSDVEVFRPENIKQFDAICFNNTAGVLFEEPELKQSLLEYVYSGKGFIGIHAAAATFVQWPVYDQWPEFGEMLGAYEDGGHPWKPHEWITVRIDEPNHPINAALRSDGFAISDEVFQFRRPYSRDKLRILLTIDTDKTDMSEDRHILPERRKDRDLAISWVRRYGRGRVFYSSFGHNKHIFWNAPVLRHYLDGIQFALGDLPAPTTPSNRLTPAIQARERLAWRLGMSAYSLESPKSMTPCECTFFEAVDIAAKLGFMYLAGHYRYRVSKDVTKYLDYNLGDEELAAVRKKLLVAAVNMATYYVRKIPPDVQVGRRLFEFCRRLGVEIIISEPEAETLDMIEKLCDQYDIGLAIHNRTSHDLPTHWDPKRVLEVCEGRSNRIGVCSNLNCWLRSAIEPTEALKTLKDRLMILYIYDLDEFSNQAGDVPWEAKRAGLRELLQEAQRLKVKPTTWAIAYPYKRHSKAGEIMKCKELFDNVTLELSGQ